MALLRTIFDLETISIGIVGRGKEVELSFNLGQKMALEIAWFPWSNFLVQFLLGSMKTKEFLFPSVTP